MGPPPSSYFSLAKENMDEHEAIVLNGETPMEKEISERSCGTVLCSPYDWFRMLAKELHWSFVFGVIVIYGISQGLGWSIMRVASDYYWKDVQLMQPSEAQVYQGITSIPWIVKPLCGLLTDVVSMVGYRRQPYFIFAGVLGLLSIPSALVSTVGIMIKEVPMPNFVYNEVCQKFLQANRIMWTTLKCPVVWRPCLYMYASLALSLNIQEGMFFWYTVPKAGPSFSQGTIGFMFAIGAIGSLLGVLLYQNILKDYPFRGLLQWSQLLSWLSGMLDLILILRLDLKFGIPDFLFVVIDESVSQMIGRLKWMPLLVLSTKLCPPGIEGTFFALLMSINNYCMLTSSWGGGLLLHMLSVTRTDFGNLGSAILIRNIMRLLPLALLFLVPKSDPNSAILPSDLLESEGKDNPDAEVEDIELVSLVDHVK